jgi:hypothetical protein
MLAFFLFLSADPSTLKPENKHEYFLRSQLNGGISVIRTIFQRYEYLANPLYSKELSELFNCMELKPSAVVFDDASGTYVQYPDLFPHRSLYITPTEIAGFQKEEMIAGLHGLHTDLLYALTLEAESKITGTLKGLFCLFVCLCLFVFCLFVCFIVSLLFKILES